MRAYTIVLAILLECAFQWTSVKAENRVARFSCDSLFHHIEQYKMESSLEDDIMENYNDYSKCRDHTDGTSPFLKACAYTNYKALEVILKAAEKASMLSSALINSTTEGQTENMNGIMLVCKSKHIIDVYAAKVINKLCDLKINVYIADSEGRYPPLLAAAKFNYPCMVALLKCAKARPNDLDFKDYIESPKGDNADNALLTACEAGSTSLKALVEFGADVTTTNEKGQNCLVKMCVSQYKVKTPELYKCVIEKNSAVIDMRDKEGRSPVYRCVQHKREDNEITVSWFVKNKAVTTEKGLLVQAVKTGNFNVVKKLLDSKVSVNKIDFNKCCMHILQTSTSTTRSNVLSKWDIFDLLYNHENCKDYAPALEEAIENGDNLLFLCSKKKDIMCMKTVLKNYNDASKESKRKACAFGCSDPEDKNALMITCKNPKYSGHDERIDMLLKICDVNVQSSADESSAGHFCAEHSPKNLIKFFEYEVKANMEDQHGRTMGHILANKTGNEDALKALDKAMKFCLNPDHLDNLEGESPKGIAAKAGNTEASEKLKGVYAATCGHNGKQYTLGETEQIDGKTYVCTDKCKLVEDTTQGTARMSALKSRALAMCESTCTTEDSPVCGSNGMKYRNKCHLRNDRCKDRSISEIQCIDEDNRCVYMGADKRNSFKRYEKCEEMICDKTNRWVKTGLRKENCDPNSKKIIMEIIRDEL